MKYTKDRFYTQSKKENKSAARQLSKKLLKQEIEEDTITRHHFDMASNQYQNDVIGEYNEGILWDFVLTLKNIAPELAWSDSSGSWTDMFYPRGLEAIPHTFRNWAPHSDKERSKLLEKILREQS